MEWNVAAAPIAAAVAVASPITFNTYYTGIEYNSSMKWPVVMEEPIVASYFHKQNKQTL